MGFGLATAQAERVVPAGSRSRSPAFGSLRRDARHRETAGAQQNRAAGVLSISPFEHEN
jgi:hypothetical protein